MKNVQEWAILDSGATSHFLVSAAPKSNVQAAVKPLTVKLPDGAYIKLIAISTISLPNLPEKAREAHIIQGLAHHSLLSIVDLCNAECEVIFTKIGCTVKYRGRIVLQGAKCTKSGLWMVPIGEPITQASIPTSNTPSFLCINTVQEMGYSIIKTSILTELVVYHH